MLRPSLVSFIETEVDALAEDDVAQRPHAAFAMAWAGALAARIGERELAKRTIGAAQLAMTDLHYPVVSQMIAVAQAQLALVEGDADAAREARKGIDADTALLAARVLDIEAMAQSGQLAAARSVADSLAAARGRAYTEYGSNYMLRPRNVIDANQALLRNAELSFADGDRVAAVRLLARFEQLWPAAKLPPAMRERVHALRSELDAG